MFKADILNSELIKRMDTPAILETRTTCSINLTSAAANQVRVTGEAGDYLRISVRSGGCSGFQYEISVDDTVLHSDSTCNSNGVNIVVDAFSMHYLEGTTIDYVDNFDGSGFIIRNPNCIA
jgi:iron-sulfur cluster insertion protein